MPFIKIFLNISNSIGTKKEFEKSSTYSTKFFYEYTIDNIDIDVMSGFAINHSDGIFEYIFDSKSISNFKTINGIKIPFTSLEDWYVIYQLIPNREYKVEMIEKYLLSNKINHPELLLKIWTNIPIPRFLPVQRVLLCLSYHRFNQLSEVFNSRLAIGTYIHSLAYFFYATLYILASLRFALAFKSLSFTIPQLHIYILSLSFKFLFIFPQLEHIFELGYHLSTVLSSILCIIHL